MAPKKLSAAIILTFILTIAYQVLGAYVISPEGLQYPNPGHHPGEIGPGTFNDSGEANPWWKFPGNLIVTEGLFLKDSSNNIDTLMQNGIIKEKFLPYCKEEITSDVYTNGENQQTGCNFGYSGYYDISHLNPSNVKKGIPFGRGQIGTYEVICPPCTCNDKYIFLHNIKTDNWDKIEDFGALHTISSSYWLVYDARGDYYTYGSGNYIVSNSLVHDVSKSYTDPTMTYCNASGCFNMNISQSVAGDFCECKFNTPYFDILSTQSTTSKIIINVSSCQGNSLGNADRVRKLICYKYDDIRVTS